MPWAEVEAAAEDDRAAQAPKEESLLPEHARLTPKRVPSAAWSSSAGEGGSGEDSKTDTAAASANTSAGSGSVLGKRRRESKPLVYTARCSVCQDGFHPTKPEDEHPIRLPCRCDRHFFHRGCVAPWIKLHGSCPDCRHKIGTPL